MADIKFCKDCKHMEKASSPEFAKCGATFVFETDYVMGDRVRRSFKYCDRARQSDRGCGPDAKLFEQKPRAWYAFWKAA